MALQEWPYLDVDDSDNEQYFLPPADQLGSEEEEELEELSAFQDEQQLAIPSVVTGQGLPFSQEEFDANHPPPVLDGHVQMALRIYDLLEHVNAPIYTFDAIIKILQESSPQCLSRIQQFPKRQAFLSKMMAQFKTCKPVPVPVQLETRTVQTAQGIGRGLRDEVTAVSYDFMTQLLDLLDDELFHDARNLVVNSADAPFRPYQTMADSEQDGRHSLEEALDGQVYQQYIARLKQEEDYDPNLDFVIPIILYTDKTGTDVYQRYALEPVMFTTPLIRRHLRQDTARTWRHLGFVPDLDLKSTASKKVSNNTKEGRGRSTRNYHKCLSAVLDPFLKAQQEKPIVILRIAGRMRRCRLRLPILFAAGDNLSGDHLCGRVGGYGEGTSCICRSCNVSFEDLDNFFVECQVRHHKDTLVVLQQNIDQARAQLKEISDLLQANGPYPTTKKDATAQRRQIKDQLEGYLDTLRSISIHRHHNAFATAEFCDSKHGIFGSTPVDLLHAFLLGILKLLITVFTDQMRPVMKDATDHLVDAHFGSLRSNQKDRFPRINFQRGFTNLTMLTAKEWAGVALVYAIVCSTTAGQTILAEKQQQDDSALLAMARRNRRAGQFVDTDERLDQLSEEDMQAEDTEGNCSSEDFREVLEEALCFYAWYKRGVFSGKQDTEKEVRETIAAFLSNIKQKLPRPDGNNWKLQKAHDLLHAARDIVRFGEPSNYDTGPMERGLQAWGKHASRTAQKRGAAKFNMQTASRIAERHCCRKALRVAGLASASRSTIQYAQDELPFESKAAPDAADGPFGNQAARFAVKFSRINTAEPNRPPKYIYKARAEIHGRQRQTGFVALHPVVVKYFEEWIAKAENRHHYRETVYCYTEWSNKGETFRAHPNYRSEGAWYDWAAVIWEEGETDQAVAPNGDSSSDGESSMGSPTRKRQRVEDDQLLAINAENWPIEDGTIMRSEDGTAEYPAMLLAFFRHPATGEARVIVHSALRQDKTWQSKICERWSLEYRTVAGHPQPVPLLRDLSVHSLTRQLLVVPESQVLPAEAYDSSNPKHSKSVLLVRDMEIYWPRFFTQETQPINV